MIKQYQIHSKQLLYFTVLYKNMTSFYKLFYVSPNDILHFTILLTIYFFISTNINYVIEKKIIIMT